MKTILILIFTLLSFIGYGQTPDSIITVRTDDDIKAGNGLSYYYDANVGVIILETNCIDIDDLLNYFEWCKTQVQDQKGRRFVFDNRMVCVLDTTDNILIYPTLEGFVEWYLYIKPIMQKE